MATDDKKKKTNFFTKIGRGLSNWFKGIVAELKKVTWPTKKELVKSTVSVLVVCLVIGVLIFGIDTILQELVSLVRGAGN